MTSPLVVDTDVMVDYFRGSSAAATLLRTNIDRIVFSSMVIAELYAGIRNDRERENLDRDLAAFPVIPVTAEIARAGGLLRSRYDRSHGVGLSDAILAATVLNANAELATCHVKHYPTIKGLRSAYAKS